MCGVELICNERERQKNEKRWTADSDDRQIGGQLLDCAVKIAGDVLLCLDSPVSTPSVSGWPQHRADHVRSKYGEDHIRRLTIAGALIAAEIDRLSRAAKTT